MLACLVGCAPASSNAPSTRSSQQALALPSISPEIPFGQPQSASDELPAAAWGGDQYLVTWVQTTHNGTQSVQATRVLSDGTQLDAPSFEVASPATGGVLASDGSSFLVGGDSPKRVLADATVVPAPMTVQPMSVAWNGTSYLAVWSQWMPYGEDCQVDPVYGAFLDTDGASLADLQVFDDTWCVTVPSGWRAAAPAYGAGVHLVAFEFPWESMGAVRLAQDGTLLDPVPLEIASYNATHPNTSPAHWFPDVAFGAGEFMVAWLTVLDPGQDAGPVLDVGVRAARVLPDGSVLDPGGVVVATAVVQQFGSPAIV